MTDAQLQPLYDLIGAVFKAGERFNANPSQSAATELVPLVQQVQAYVEELQQEAYAACAWFVEAGLHRAAVEINNKIHDKMTASSAPSPFGSAT